MVWWTVYTQDAKCTAVEAVAVKWNVNVGMHEVTFKRILGTKTDTEGMSWKQTGSLPQYRVRWQ